MKNICTVIVLYSNLLFERKDMQSNTVLAKV